jgi:hypothetical protein
MPTRITTRSATLIDHMYYFEGSGNKHHSVSIKAGNFLEDITDHLPNYVLILKETKQNNCQRPLIRIFSQKNIDEYIRLLHTADWSVIYNCSDVNVCYNKFSEIISSAFNKCFPFTRLSKKRSKDKKWITSALIKSSNVKNKLYKKWLSSRNEIDETKYKQYRSIFRKTADAAESLYYKELFDIKSNSVKKLWSNLNEVSSFKNKTLKPNISKLVVNNCSFTHPVDICNELNSYFSTVGEKLVNKLANKQPIKKSFTSYYDAPTKNSMFCSPIDKLELLTQIFKLNNNKSPGPDNIGPKLVKCAATVLVDPLVYIYNLSFSAGIVPEKLKLAKILPIFKKGERHCPSNYRPISLLSIFDKLLEKLMCCRLMQYLQANNILYNYQFGFRKYHSTSLALIEVIDSIYEGIDQGSKVSGIYLDLQKAFDTVSHDILLDKLYNYGIRGIVQDWFCSYLNNRRQFTCVMNASSSISRNLYGVPQGSVLGPILFLIYVNDIGNAVPGEKVKLFADDTNLFIFNENISIVNENANYCINLLNQWFINNKLSLNLTKTCSMVIPSKYQDYIKIVVDGIEIEKVSNCKYLGIVLDNKLKWTEHINLIYKKLIKFISIFYKIRNKLPDKLLKNIYFAFVYPHILYGIEIYANTCSSYLDKLSKLNNKILRILQNKPLSTPIYELYVNYNTLPLHDLQSQQILILVHKFLFHNHTLPEVFTRYFTINKFIHNYNTRTSSNIHIFKQNRAVGQRSLKYKAGCLWNALPDHLKSIMSVNAFKCKLRSYLLSRHLL